MAVIIQIVAFWLCYSIVLQLYINNSEEDVTSTFKVKVCRVKNQLNNMGQFLGRWSLKSLRGNVYPEGGVWWSFQNVYNYLPNYNVSHPR
jgi:hypothetical protein